MTVCSNRLVQRWLIVVLTLAQYWASIGPMLDEEVWKAHLQGRIAIHFTKLSYSLKIPSPGSGDFSLPQPSKHEAFARCCFNVRPASKTLAQHWNSIGWMSHLYWERGNEFQILHACPCVRLTVIVSGFSFWIFRWPPLRFPCPLRDLAGSF